MAAPDFWTHQESAQETVREVKQLKNWLDPFDGLVSRVQGARELAEMLDAEPDAEMDAELDRDIAEIAHQLEEFRLRSLLSRPRPCVTLRGLQAYSRQRRR